MSMSVSITHAADAKALWVVRDRMRFMGDLAGTDLFVVEVDVPPGSGTPPHHHASPEIFRVLSGEITFGVFADGPPQQVRAGAGAVVTVPSDVGHNYVNLSGQPASMLVVADRRMKDFFLEIGRTDDPPAGPPTDAEIGAVMAACARHGVHMLGGKP